MCSNVLIQMLTDFNGSLKTQTLFLNRFVSPSILKRLFPQLPPAGHSRSHRNGKVKKKKKKVDRYLDGIC